MDISLLHTITNTLHQNQPWLTDKLGGAVISQTIKELWDQVKSKLGHATAEKLETKPDDPIQWELFKAKLLVALDEDPAFAEKLSALAARSEAEGPVISQTATGTDIDQVAVDRSQNVKISMH